MDKRRTFSFLITVISPTHRLCKNLPNPLRFILTILQVIAKFPEKGTLNVMAVTSSMPSKPFIDYNISGLMFAPPLP